MAKKTFEGEPIQSTAAIEEARQVLKDQRSARLGAALPTVSNVLQLVQASDGFAVSDSQADAVLSAQPPSLAVVHAHGTPAFAEGEESPVVTPGTANEAGEMGAPPAGTDSSTTASQANSRQRRGNRRKPDKSVIVRSDGSSWRQRSVYLEADFSRAIDIHCAEVQQDITHVLSDWIREGYERARKGRK